MVGSPFSLGLILKVLPRLKRQYNNNNKHLQLKITRLQIYKAFSDQWFDNEIMRLQNS